MTNTDKRTEKNLPLRLRPHHGLCIYYFRGSGYSEEFTEHMKEVIRSLKDNPRIILTVGEDEVCSSCPNRTPRGCSESQKAESYDRKVLELCGLFGSQNGPGGSENELRWEEFRQAVVSRIIRAGKRREVCGNCEWDGLCERIAEKA